MTARQDLNEKKEGSSEAQDINELKNDIEATFDHAKSQIVACGLLVEKIDNLKLRTLEELKKGEIEISYAKTIAGSTLALIDSIQRDFTVREDLSREQAMPIINAQKKAYKDAIKLFLKNTNPPFKQRCREIGRAIGMLVGAIIGFFLCYKQSTKKVETKPQEKEEKQPDSEAKKSEPVSDPKQNEVESTRPSVTKGIIGGAAGLSAGYYAASFFTRNTKEGITALADEATTYCKRKIQAEKDKLPPEEPEEESSSRICCCW